MTRILSLFGCRLIQLRLTGSIVKVLLGRLIFKTELTGNCPDCVTDGSGDWLITKACWVLLFSRWLALPAVRYLQLLRYIRTWYYIILVRNNPAWQPWDQGQVQCRQACVYYGTLDCELWVFSFSKLFFSCLHKQAWHKSTASSVCPSVCLFKCNGLLIVMIHNTDTCVPWNSVLFTYITFSSLCIFFPFCGFL